VGAVKSQRKSVEVSFDCIDGQPCSRSLPPNNSTFFRTPSRSRLACFIVRRWQPVAICFPSRSSRGKKGPKSDGRRFVDSQETRGSSCPPNPDGGTTAVHLCPGRIPARCFLLLQKRAIPRTELTAGDSDPFAVAAEECDLVAVDGNQFRSDRVLSIGAGPCAELDPG
jgi:hypothetical protein